MCTHSHNGTLWTPKGVIKSVKKTPEEDRLSGLYILYNVPMLVFGDVLLPQTPLNSNYTYTTTVPSLGMV